MKNFCLIGLLCASVSFTLLAQIDTLREADGVITTAPEFQGGPTELKKYINTYLVYPKRARQRRIEGKVYVQFSVEEDGSITSVRISKGLCNECDEEVLRLIQNSPRWIPATENNVPVKNWMILPIEFTLKKDE